MDLHVAEYTHLRTIKTEFSRLYPYLRLTLFTHPHQPENGVVTNEPLPDDLTVLEASQALSFQALPVNGHLRISPWMTVTNLEHAFRQTFGLNVQVLLQSGDHLPGSTTGWTLHKHNAMARQLAEIRQFLDGNE